MKITELKALPVGELISLGESSGLENASRMKRQDIVFGILKNKAKEGVKVTATGLQYRVLKSGSGKVSPKETDTVKVHYKGTLIDGTEFDSSYERKEPTQFVLNRVIKGWTEALKLMKEGDKWELVIPSEIGYGERGAPPVIGPNAVLIFEVELLDIESTPAKT